MFVRTLTVALLFVAVSALADDTTVADDVARLVTELDDSSRSVRRAAERRLVALGTSALDHLPAPERLPTVGSREAVRRVRILLERQRADESIRASTLTLDGERTVAEWLDEIERGTGNGFDTAKIGRAMLDRVVAFSVEDRPFWEFVDVDLRRLGLGIGPSQGDRLSLFPTEDATRPLRVTYVGGFRVALVSLVRRPRFGAEGEDLLRASLSVRAEPRMRPLFLVFGGDEVRASLVGGGDIASLDPAAKFDLPLGQGVGEPRVDLRLDASDEDVLVDLEGRLHVTVAAGEASFRFPSLDESVDVARRRGGVTVRVTDTETARTGETWRAEAAINVVYDTGGPAFESHRSWVYGNRAALEDATGRRIPFRPPATTTRQSDGGIAIRYTFAELANNPSSYRFVYDAPMSIVDVPLPFAWKSLKVAPLASR